jgi:linalool 8-monooxygenase
MQDTPVMATSTATRPDFKNPDLYVQGVPHDLFAQVRATEPVYWNPESDGPGFWAVLRYADIVEVSRQPLLFSSAHANGGHRIFNENEVGLTGAGKARSAFRSSRSIRRCTPSIARS